MLFSTPFFPDHERGQDPGTGTPLYKLHRYVPPQRVGFLDLFGLKTLSPFWSGIRYDFRGNYGSVNVRTYLLF